MGKSNSLFLKTFIVLLLDSGFILLSTVSRKGILCLE